MAKCPKRDVTIEYRDEKRAVAYAKQIATANREMRKQAKLASTEDEPVRELTYRERMELEFLEQAEESKQGSGGLWPFS